MSARLRTLLLTIDGAARARRWRPAAAPDGANVVGGTATVSGAGTNRHRQPVQQPRHHQLEHVQHRRPASSATFNQPDSSSVALNRVTGGLGPSRSTAR